MEKKRKIKLSGLKIKSFVTSIDTRQTFFGGVSQGSPCATDDHNCNSDFCPPNSNFIACDSDAFECGTTNESENWCSVGWVCRE